MNRKLMSVLLIFCMMLSMMPMAAFAEEVAEAAENVAAIGDTQYATLQAAVDAVSTEATTSSTIRLLKDAAGNGVKVASNKNVVIDLNNHTYTIDGALVGSTGTESQAFQLLKGATVTIQNGSIESSKAIMLIQNYCDLTLENVKLTGGASVQYAISCNAGNTKLNGVDINIESKNVALDVMHWHGSYPTAPTVTVNNTNDNTINGKIDVYCYGTAINNETDEQKAKLAIHGGTFSDVSAINYLAAGADVNVTLAADCEASVTVPEGATVTLDLNNHKLTNTAGNNTITNNGTLTITGNGTVDNVSHQKAALYNNGTATLNGGNFTRSQENGQSSTYNGGNSFYNILNHGEMTVNEGVTVEQTGHFSSLFENGWQNGNQNTGGKDSVLIINGGTFTGGLNTIKNDDYGNLTINGGTFTNTTQATLLN